MTVNEIVQRLDRLDTALRVVESEGRDLEEKIRKGIIVMLPVLLYTCFTCMDACSISCICL